MKVWVEKARRPELLGGIGGFAGLFDATALKAFDHPLLATSADGVGTKVAIAQALDIHHTIGFDLVGMLVDDLVVCGAEPLFLTDYIATGRVVPERIAAIVQGHRRGLRAGRLRARRRRDRRAPGPARPRRVRRRRRDHRRRGGGRPARGRPCRGGRRRRRDGIERAALQRLLAGAPRAAERRGRGLVARPPRRRARPHPRRGAARADHDLRQGLPGPRPQRLDARDVARHRRRPGGQPRAGDARQPGRHHRSRHVDPASRSSTWSARSGRSTRPPWRARSTAVSAWSRCCQRPRASGR